jgi:hypothetical protein
VFIRDRLTKSNSGDHKYIREMAGYHAVHKIGSN